jgi:hypothetical protein
MIMAAAPQKSIAEAAAELIAAGYPVCRIDPAEKKPTYGSWQLKSLQPQDFADHENIGIVFGLNGHAGIDLDFHPRDVDAWEAADEILPETAAEEGRPGCPRAHRIFIITDPENVTDLELPGGDVRTAMDAGTYPRFPGTRHFSDKTHGRQIDFLLAGSQCACPPSYHAASDTRREWFLGEMGEPAPITWAELKSAVYALCHRLGMEAADKVAPEPVSAELLAKVDGHSEAQRMVSLLQKQTPKTHGQGQNYHGQQFAVACDLAEHGVPIELAWPIYREWNQNTLTVDADPVLKDILKRGYAASCFGSKAAIVVEARRSAGAASIKGSGHFLTAADLIGESKGYREPLIDGLLRRGETMNVIAAPKTGKSWLVMQLAFSVAHGVKWMGRECAQGTVLLIDNELHKETLGERLRAVSKAMRVDARNIHAWCLRGALRPLTELATAIIERAKVVGADVIVFDALYRLIPAGVSENDNSGMMGMYNILDQIAEETGAACICVHHSSKGNQSEKSTTDGGAGAGAISRAADSHLFLRQHEDEGQVSIDAVARSWPPPDPWVIAFDGIWHLVPGADPSRLKKASRNGSGKAATVAVAEIVARLPQSPMPYKVFVADCSVACDCTKQAVESAIGKAVAQGDACLPVGVNNAKMIVCAGGAYDASGSKSDCVREYLRKHPDALNKDICMACECDVSLVRKVRNE